MPITAVPDSDVVFALTGDVRRNSRALRQLRVLSEIDLSVTVLSFGPSPASPDVIPGVHLQIVEEPTGTGPLYFWRVHRRMREAALRVPARVYHASDLYTLPAAYAAARNHGGKIVFDSRELYPHVGATAGRPWATLFWSAIEHRYVPQTDAVLTVNDSIAERLTRNYHVARPVVLPNVPARRTVQPNRWLRDQLDLSDETTLILFLGHLKAGRGCEMLIDAFRDVNGAHLAFVGEGPLETTLKTRADVDALRGRVHFHPLVPPDDVPAVASSADVGVALIEDRSASLYLSLPNKLFEYVAAGLPVLASDFPEIRKVVVDHDVGLVVDPADRRQITVALQRMIEDAESRRAWSANTPNVLETFSWEEASERFKDVYRTLLHGAPSP